MLVLPWGDPSRRALPPGHSGLAPMGLWPARDATHASYLCGCNKCRGSLSGLPFLCCGPAALCRCLDGCTWSHPFRQRSWIWHRAGSRLTRVADSPSILPFLGLHISGSTIIGSSPASFNSTPRCCSCRWYGTALSRDDCPISSPERGVASLLNSWTEFSPFDLVNVVGIWRGVFSNFHELLSGKVLCGTLVQDCPAPTDTNIQILWCSFRYL